MNEKTKIIRYPSPYLITLSNSPEDVFRVFVKTTEFLKINKNYVELIDLCLWVNRDILNLIPETTTNFWSGHIFPLSESEYELESSVDLALLGFYKQAISSLRNYLELGLLSIYWNIEDEGHIVIQNWLHSLEDTPFRNKVIKELLKNKNISKFNKEINIAEEINTVYKEICNYTHTKGLKYSSRTLIRSNVNNFNEKAFIKWLNYFKRVVQIITKLHLLKYPIGLQYTPIMEKFGLKGPWGGFLTPYQSEKIKEIFDDKTLKILQVISDEDKSTIALAKEINNLPDVTNEEFAKHLEDEDKFDIEMMGFKNWLRNKKVILKLIKGKNNSEYKSIIKDIEKMRKWAKSKKFMRDIKSANGKNVSK